MYNYSMYAMFAYVGVVPGGSMGRHIFQSHGVFGYSLYMT